MTNTLSAAETALDLWLAEQTDKSLLRFSTCGSVDDGKSTLIGRLLYDSQLILDDQLASLRKESRNRTTGDEGIDFSLLVDGLTAEREQGITIDVAYRFFSTDKRKFIVADTPGHEQYTRNMATGASNADLAIVLIDARKGVLTQTAAAQLHPEPDRREACRAGGQQDRPRRLRRRRVQRHRDRVPGLRQGSRLRDAGGHPGVGAQGRQHPRPPAPTCPGIAARSSCPTSRASRSRPTAPTSRCAFRCSG